MVDARRLSDDFAKKAESDLELAQDIAASGMPGHHGESREPGYALGTCMHHAQQALEKRIKSSVILVDDILGVTHDDGDSMLANELRHPIYPAIHKYYASRLGRLRSAGIAPGRAEGDPADGGGAGATGSREANLRLLCGFWDRYSRDHAWRLRSWRRSVGIRLEAGDRRDLDIRNGTYAGLLAGLIGQGAPGPPDLGTPPPEISPRECLDAGALGRRRAEHAAGPTASGLSAALDREFRKCRADALNPEGGGSAPRDAHVRAARRAVLDFGLVLLLCHSVPYMALLPHNTLGRYPKALNGLTTTDLYGRQARHVLHHLFVGVPHSLGQMSDYTGRIGGLWEGVAGP